MLIPLYLIVFLILSGVLYWFTQGALFVPTHPDKVQKIMELAQIQPNMKAVDLGSGDGRIVIAMSQAGAEAHGFEINPVLVWWARRNIRKLGLGKTAFIHWGNFWKTNFSAFDVVVVFGIDYIMPRLEKKFYRELKTGAKVVSYAFPLPNKDFAKKESGVLLYQF